MKEITIYELIKLIKEDKAPSKVIYDDRVWNQNEKAQDYYNKKIDDYLFVLVCREKAWLDFKVMAFDESENKSNEEMRLDMQTVKKWINDIVKVVNNGNR